MEQLVKKLKNVLKNNPKIIDFIIFGSLVKRKLEPIDIDIAAIIEDNVDRLILKKEINEPKIDLQLIKIQDYDRFIWLTLIREGFSVKHNNFIYKIHKIKPVILYKYSLKKLTPSKKVMFERAIKSFKNIEKLSNRVVMVPIDYSGEFSDFLGNWNLDIDSEEYALLPLVRKEEI